MTKLPAFLAGERPDDVALYLAADAVEDIGAVEPYGEAVPGGVVLVVPGEQGRAAFRNATGTDAMAFANEAMGTEGEIDADLTGGTCPEGPDHDPRFVFAFVEAENPEAGGIYAEGAVVHAYAACECGTAYSDRWVAGER